MVTLVTRKGRTSIHQLRKLWRERDAVNVEAPRPSAEERERVAREDEDIKARRDAYPLY